jgi:hypothetical protein
MSDTSLTADEAKALFNGAYGYAGWSKQAATDDFNATGGVGKGAGSSSDGGGGGTSDTDEFVSLLAQLTGSPTVLPELSTKSWEEYETEALEELRPYYERILKEEGGDVERAKLRLEDDYKRGVRLQREDYTTAQAGYGSQMQPGETMQQYYNRTKNEYGSFPEEGISQFDKLAQRGMVNSGFAAVDASKLATAQQRRQEAIKTALNRYEEGAGITRARGLEDIKTAWDRRQFELGEEEKEKAVELGRQARADETATQEIERSNIMRKAIQNLYG